MGTWAAKRTESFAESVIREMTRLCQQYHGRNGINLAQGFPDFPAPREVKEAAATAILADVNQYSITWGAAAFRQAIARKVERHRGLSVDPETEVTVSCGATEAMISTMLAILNPGDEVFIFAPYYENYRPDAALAEAKPRFVMLHEPDWAIDPQELRSAFGPKTRAVVVNTPHNPTGKVFSRDELEQIAELCQEWNVVAITDEIYEHIIYSGEHISLATLSGMRDRTVTISGLSKTFSVTGWRVGYAIAAPHLTDAIRKVHDYLTVAAPTPFQAAGVLALDLPDSYYEGLMDGYRQRREFAIKMLESLGFLCYHPHGAYYIMADITPLGADNDVEFSRQLVKEVGVAIVPGSSFYHSPELGRTKVRFAFAKRMATLQRTSELLSQSELLQTKG